MGIKRTSGQLPLFSTNNNLDTKLEEIMNMIGEIGVKWAIQNHEFGNITHNLEDSYGYAVYKYGIIQGAPFVTNQNATEPRDGKYGHQEAIKFLQSFNANTQGWSVVVVAAMQYANFVQFMYGLDVLQGSEIVARQAANKLFKNIKWISR